MKLCLKTALGLFSLLIMTACTSILPMIAPTVEHEDSISDQFPFKSNHVSVLGSSMHYVDVGKGRPVILVHGNPTSSYLWRNIIPTLAKSNRVIALDLIGMGKSGDPDIEYTLQDHQRYFTAFMQALALKDVALVLHDWGGAIGVNYALTYSDNVRSIMMMEAVLRPIEWSEVDMVGRYIFKKLRDDRDGHKLIVEDNYFVEKLLPMMTGRDLSESEMANYREPYATYKSRKPVMQWPREIPISGEPQRNVESVGQNYAYLKSSKVPLHFIHANPGLIYSEKFIKQVKQEIPRAYYTNIGEGMHYIQETKPAQIANIISLWLTKH